MLQILGIINDIWCKIFRKDIGALLLKARLFEISEKYEDAIEVYKDILKIDSSIAECYTKICDCYWGLNDIKNAYEYINLAILNNPSCEKNYYSKVNLLNKMERFEESLKTLKKLEEINPHAENLNYFYSLIQSRIGEHNKALLSINKQLMMEKDAYNYAQKFKCLYNLDMYDEVIKTYQKAQDIEESALCSYWIACCYEQKQDYSEALKFINKSILLDTGDEWSFFVQSRILSAMGKFKEAEKAYKKALELGFEE